MATTSTRRGRNLKNNAAIAAQTEQETSRLALLHEAQQFAVDQFRAIKAAETKRNEAEGEYNKQKGIAGARRIDAYSAMAQEAHDKDWSADVTKAAIDAALAEYYGNDANPKTTTPVRSVINTYLDPAVRFHVPGIIANCRELWGSDVADDKLTDAHKALRKEFQRLEFLIQSRIRAARGTKQETKKDGTVKTKAVAPVLAGSAKEMAVQIEKARQPVLPSDTATKDLNRVLKALKDVAEEWKAEEYLKPIIDALKEVQAADLVKTLKGEKVSKQVSAVTLAPSANEPAPAPAPAPKAPEPAPKAPEPVEAVAELDDLLAMNMQLMQKLMASRGK